MTISLSTITGASQTGLTSPTYTVTADTAPDANGKQWAITALGGTQTGVEAHSVAAPFTVSFFRPRQFKALGKANPVTGVVNQVPRNVYKVIVRKGVEPLSGQPFSTMLIETTISVPAGSDLADPESVRAGLSAAIGALSQVSSGLGDTLVNGVL